MPIDATALEHLVEQLRTARVEGRTTLLQGPGHIQLGRPPRSGDGGIHLDPHNNLAEVDARLPLAVVARRLHERGWVMPLARPLPWMSLMTACATVPFITEAIVQQADIVSVDGDVFDTPRAPRHAAGPSLLHGVCTRPPLGLVLRARIRVFPTSHVVVVREEPGDANAAARRLQELIEEGRAFFAEARGGSVLSLRGAAGGTGGHELHGPPAWSEGRRHAVFRSGRSLFFGAVDDMTAALHDGDRVVAAPFMQRVGVLTRHPLDTAVVDLGRAVTHLADALRWSA